MQTIFFIIVAGLIVWGAIVATHRNRSARRAALAALARRRGWQFDSREDSDFPERHDHFGLFAEGRSRCVYNRLAGERPTKWGGLLFQVGDYRSEVNEGEDSKTRRGSYLFSRLPFPLARSMSLLIRPEGVRDRLKAALGFDDIDFESAEFSRRYFVEAADRKFAYDVIHPRVIEYLLASPCGRLELHGSWVVLSGSELSIWGAPEIEAAVEWWEGFVALWPDYLVEDLSRRVVTLD